MSQNSNTSIVVVGILVDCPGRREPARGHVGTAGISLPRRSCFETRIHRVAGKLSAAYIQRGTIIP